MAQTRSAVITRSNVVKKASLVSSVKKSSQPISKAKPKATPAAKKQKKFTAGLHHGMPNAHVHTLTTEVELDRLISTENEVKSPLPRHIVGLDVKFDGVSIYGGLRVVSILSDRLYDTLKAELLSEKCKLEDQGLAVHENGSLFDGWLVTVPESKLDRMQAVVKNIEQWQAVSKFVEKVRDATSSLLIEVEVTWTNKRRNFAEARRGSSAKSQ